MCNDENERKKAFLRQYAMSRRREDEINQEIEALETRYGLHSPIIDDMPHGSGGGSGLEEFAAQYDKLWRKLKAQRAHSINVYHDIVDAVEAMPCGEDKKTLLRYRYLLGRTWEETAVFLHVTYRHTLRLHGEALKLFEIPKKNQQMS